MPLQVGSAQEVTPRLVLLLLLGPWSPAAALDAPQALEAFDTPSDGGDSIGLRWRAVPADSAATSYEVLVSDQQGGEFKQIAVFPARTHYESEISGPWWVWWSKRADMHFFQVKSNSGIQLVNGRPYFFKVVRIDGQVVADEMIEPTYTCVELTVDDWCWKGAPQTIVVTVP